MIQSDLSIVFAGPRAFHVPGLTAGDAARLRAERERWGGVVDGRVLQPEPFTLLYRILTARGGFVSMAMCAFWRELGKSESMSQKYLACTRFCMHDGASCRP